MHTHSSIHLGAVRPRSSEHTKHPDLGSYKSFSTKKSQTELLGAMADSKAGAGKVQYEPRTPSARK